MPKFYVCEGYFQLILDAFKNPKNLEEDCSLFETFRVTAEARSLILERSNQGENEVLIKLSHRAAKALVSRVNCVYGNVMRTYSG